MNIRFFIDFDGTISTNDVVDLVLARFAKEEWKDTEALWAAGKIGSRECLSLQMALVSATEEEMKKLLGEVCVDPGFKPFLETLKKFSYDATIVSDGFDFIIQSVLEAHGVRKPLLPPVYCNHLGWKDSRLSVSFANDKPCAHGCANCKPLVMERLRKPGEFSVFIGDGLSDRFAAKAADLTFAKGRLLDFCRENRLAHIGYSGFAEIEAWVLKTKSPDMSALLN